MDKWALSKSKAFHGRSDAEMIYRPRRVITTHETRYVIIQERELSYRFHLHQHPYVQPLVQKLLRKGISELQAADTEFQTRIRMTNATPGVDTLDRAVVLAAGEAFSLTDGATATLGAEQIRFAGSKVFSLLDERVMTPVAAGAITLPAKAIVRRANGTLVTLDADAAATLVEGVPSPTLYAEIFSATKYNPGTLVQPPYPVKDIDFSSSGAYAAYNWELFFHVPLMIAIHLSKNQRFAEAQRWLHYLFDPTDDSNGATPERFWKVRPFQTTDVKKVEQILVNLATGDDEDLRNETIRSIEAWKHSPFRPHVVARYRQQAYMYKTVMAYLDNLIAWGDSLFRQDTGEAIDEALMLYVLAANILGPRPLPVPKKGTVRAQTYANLRQDLAAFGTVMRDLEPEIPFDLLPPPTPDGADTERLATLRSMGKALYFCVPRNDKLMGYWDTVADRLFKIRNSLNLQGVFRQLALFEPPIDPALLARGAAAGLDIGAIVNGLNQPLPLVRFAFLVQKAAEIAQEVKSLGNSLLSAMEKEDGEAMALLRAKHERVVMEMVEHVRYGQLQEAIKAKEGMLQSLAMAVQRYVYYERQLGRKAEEIETAIPNLDDLDKPSLEKMKFASREPATVLRDIEVNIAGDLDDSRGLKVSSFEAEELSKSEDARAIQDIVKALQLSAQGLSIIPDFAIDAHYWGLGSSIDTSGGKKLSEFAQFGANIALTEADRLTYEAGRAAKLGSYARREQDWTFQSNLAAGEIAQVNKQLRAAQLREAIAERELKSHRQQMKHAEEVERFLNGEGSNKTGKRTNKALYAWMKREVRGLYSQSFQFAFDIAKKAERALQHELGKPELSYLQFGYLAGREGLLSGEKLYLDIKRMEMAYHDQNQREYELTKHVSLVQIDPLALVQLRATGRCTFRLPESLLDMDGPGHYFRRIKTVAVSLPCVIGPYASVNCTLTLLKSSIRKTPVVGDDYARVDAEDERFSDHFGSMQSIVTSSAQNDSGLFETNLRDERYLPFENSGVISEWQLQLPADPSKKDAALFDYDTIADVVLHVRYTAREGGALLRNAAAGEFKRLIADGAAAGSVRLFSVRHEFPSAWANFKSQTPSANQRYELALAIAPERYPYWSQGRLKEVARVDLLARSLKAPVPGTLEVFDRISDQPQAAKNDTLAKVEGWGSLLLGRLTGGAAGIDLPATPAGELRLYFDSNDISDAWLAVTWNGSL